MKFFDVETLPVLEGETPTRAQMAVQDTWDLAPLYPSDEAWEKELDRYRKDLDGIAAWRGRLAESASTLAQALSFFGELNLRSERLGEYARLRVCEDSSNADALSRQERLSAVETRASELASFVTPELQAIEDKRFTELVVDTALKEWRTYLNKIRRFRPHTLSQDEERLMALASEPLYGHSTAFSQLTNVDMKFGVLADNLGKNRELTQSSFSSFLVNPDRDLRARAFHQFYKEFSEHQYTLAATLSNSIKADVFGAKARRHPSALEAALFSDDVPVRVYDNLIATVRKNLPALFDYFELRRTALKLDEIHHYDTYVPIVPSIQTDYSFDEATGMILEALQPLGDEYVQTLEDGLRRKRWCDRYEARGKRSGAFSSGSYGNPPYMLMNYKRDVFSDVYTLAHEAGHSMHTWYSQKHQTFQDYPYTIFVAEVASTFNETLLTHHLLSKTQDPRWRAFLINRQLDDIRSTLFRQTMFAEFEKKAHARQEAGEGLTLQSFREIHGGLLKDYFGPRFTIDTELEIECLRIPHFYNAFYVYKYATGLAAAIALADKVLNEGASARDDYLKFLKTGGALMPLEALRVAGVDMSGPEAIDSALELFARRVAELRTLVS